MTTGQVIRWSTAGVLVGVAAVAAVASYEHAYALVRAHGEAGWTGAGAADGGRADIRQFDGDAGLRAPQDARSCASSVAPGPGHRGDARGQRGTRPRRGPVDVFGAGLSGAR